MMRRRLILLLSVLLCCGLECAAQTVVPEPDIEYWGEELPESVVTGRRRWKGRKYGREWRQHYRLIYNFNKIYPYALVGRSMMAQVDSVLEHDALKRRDRDIYIKDVEKELFRLFEKDIRSMTISQGFLLTRLVDRECGRTAYDIIVDYEGKFAAGFWSLVGKLFDQDLKKQYDPSGIDAETEQLVLIWESGDWDMFYYSVFGQYPQKTVIQTDRLSSKPKN